MNKMAGTGIHALEKLTGKALIPPSKLLLRQTERSTAFILAAPPEM
jgi:hypothetical protein